MLSYILVTARPKQWVKNVFVFAGLLFAQDFFLLEKGIDAIMAFVSFCFISSGVYLINDVADRKKDALHPKKSHRPVAAGLLPPLVAAGAAFFLFWLAWPLHFISDCISDWSLLLI